MADLEDDILEASASPVKRSFKRLKRKGEQASARETLEEDNFDSTTEANEPLIETRFREDDDADGLEREFRTGNSDEEKDNEHQEGFSSEGEDDVIRREFRTGDSDDDVAADEESDEEEELARMLAKEKEIESEGEGSGSEDGSQDRNARRDKAASERSEKEGEGSEAEADELDFDRDRDEDEYEGPAQQDVLLKKHKRKRPGEEEDIHAESQRLLRETRGVAFKAHVTDQKPLSGLLEKIRKRKEELFRASQPPERSRAPEKKSRRPSVIKSPPAERQRRIGESSDEEEQEDDDDSDDEMLLEIITSKKEKERCGAEKVEDRLPEDSPPEADDVVNQNGYEGDMEEDDEELTFDFLDKAPEKEKLEKEEPKKQAPIKGKDGFVDEDKSEEAGEACAPEREARPFFPMFQRKVAKVPKFDEAPVEAEPAPLSEPQFDDETVEPVAGSQFQDGQAPDEDEGIVSDQEDLFGNKREKDADDVRKDVSPLQEAQPKRKHWEWDGSDDELFDKPARSPEPAPPKAKSKVNEAVRMFVDDQAEEEDSDGNLGNLSDDDEDPAANDDMEYVIDTRAEAVIDNGEKERLRLHREWVEQQDAKDTKELLDRMKNGWHRPGAAGALLDSDEDDDLDADDLRRRRMRLKAAARARGEAFGDDYDADAFAANEEALSEDDGPGSEDEEFREQVLRRRRLQESESMEPDSFELAEDEASREVLGLIKRAAAPKTGPSNVPPGKENAHGSLLGLFSKRKKALKISSSFLNRACSTSRDASNVTTANGGSGTGRYFIFGRDDSNSALERRETNDKDLDKEQNPLNPAASKAPTNFAGIASRVGAHKSARASGALAPSAFFGLLSRGSKSESQEQDALPAELPSFLREVGPIKKSAFVR